MPKVAHAVAAAVPGLALAACVAALPALAAEDAGPIGPDRPDFVDSSDVVGRGRVQLEFGLAGERTMLGGQTLRGSSTPLQLRIGVSDDWELRLASDGRLSARDGAVPGTRERGWGDLSVGLKWHQQDGDEETLRPGLGWVFRADLDTGSRAFRGQGTRPAVNFVAEWEFAGGYSLGVMPGLYVERNDEGRRYAGAVLAAVVGKSINDRTQVFAEVAGQQLASARHGGKIVTFDVGATYRVTDDLQVDAALSRGLTKQSPDVQWTIGASVRF